MCPIVKVPLQTVHETENIWNSNADNKQDSLSTRDFLTNTEKEKIKELASQVPDSIRNRFANLVDKWNIAIDHNPKTRYSASTYSYAKLPEFIPLKSMGKQILPLIMEVFVFLLCMEQDDLAALELALLVLDRTE